MQSGEPIRAGGTYVLTAENGFLLAEGLWVKRGDNVEQPTWDSIQIAHVECENYVGGAKRCLDVSNVVIYMHEEINKFFPPPG
jgi:hypothetical protein